MPLPPAMSLMLVAKYPFLKKRSMHTVFMVVFISAIKAASPGVAGYDRQAINGKE
jgi:hypothetical protein